MILRRRVWVKVRMLAQLRHPHCVLLLGVCLQVISVRELPSLQHDYIADVQPEHECIITEFMPQGSVADLLHARPDPSAAPIPFSTKLDILVSCSRGLCYLHAHLPPIVHRGLKVVIRTSLLHIECCVLAQSSNLLMDHDGSIKVCDYVFVVP